MLKCSTCKEQIIDDGMGAPMERHICSKKDWKMKVKVVCPECRGTKTVDYYPYSPCRTCTGSGEVVEEVPAKAVNKFMDRPEKAHFACVGCRKQEDILRPLPNQLPGGWLNWSGDVICVSCKSKVVLAALVAAEQKVRQLKETK